ncbi:MAG: ABC superfamily ATP binding cassette transporter, ABC/membrane protein, partial [Actinomyces urogenitalis DORA_12]
REMLSLGEAIAHFLSRLYLSLFSCATIIVGCWIWDARIGLALTFSAPLVVLGLLAIRLLNSKGHRMVDPVEKESAMRVVEFAQCQGALRAAGAVERYEELTEAMDQANAARKKSLWLETLAQVIGGGFVQGCVLIMVSVIATLTVSGSMGLIETIATLGLSLSFSNELTTVMNSLTGMDDRRVLLNTVEELLEAEELPETDQPEPLVTTGSVALHEVDFSYDKDNPVIQGVSFEVAPRSMCAIVGPSGSGKTTLLRLISRFYDVDDGEILLGGVDVRQAATTDLMSQLSMVFQDVYLFDETLEANIRLARPDASEADLAEAARLAGVDEIVERLPLGWQTKVGEGGRALSGGERQRVSIARALLKRAPIVLFDEATSALDAENEQNIVASMEKLREDATLIVVAHKLETIVAADQIVALDDDGRVAQVGTHAELVAQDGPYKRFWTRRQEAAGWALVSSH